MVVRVAGHRRNKTCTPRRPAWESEARLQIESLASTAWIGQEPSIWSVRGPSWRGAHWTSTAASNMWWRFLRDVPGNSPPAWLGRPRDESGPRGSSPVPIRGTHLSRAEDSGHCGRAAAVAAPQQRAGAHFIATAKRHHIDPFAYLRGVFARISAHPKNRLEELLLDRRLAARAAAS